MAEEVGAEALEFFYGVGGVEGAGGVGALGEVGELGGYEGGGGLGGGVGGVDDVERVAEALQGGCDKRLDERVVGAAQQEGGGVRGGGEGFGEVDAEDFGGDGVVDPAFFYEGN